MTQKPSRTTLDSVDDLWDAVHPRSRRDGKARSPTRSGTNPWDDRTLPLFGGGAASTCRVGTAAASPVRLPTGSWDDLLPPAVKHRHEAIAAAERAARPVRGGTRSWDELLAELRAAGGEAAALHVAASDVVFGSGERDPFEDLPPDLLEFLAPKSTANR